MATVLALSGSPSRVSRTDAVVTFVADQVAADGHVVTVLPIRDLPPAALVAAAAGDPRIAESWTMPCGRCPPAWAPTM